MLAHTHDILAALVRRAKCKPGWTFRLQIDKGDVYPKLVIGVPGYDSAKARSTDIVLKAAAWVDRLYSREAGQDDINGSLEVMHNAWGSHRELMVNHFFPVPEATYNETSWRRWIFECCRRVENHELGEWFRDGAERPFSPLHGPGEDPYTVHEYRPAVDALTTQDGSTREPYE